MPMNGLVTGSPIPRGGFPAPRASPSGPSRSQEADALILGVPKETFPGERRVALTPGVLPSLAKAGHEVLVEPGAGE